MGERFEYKYNAPTQKERQEINSIRNQYLPKDKAMTKYERLKKLDSKVKNIPLILGLSFGVIGTLIFGSGLTFFLEWIDLWFLGLPLGILGVIVIALAYPIYKKVLNNLKNKYSSEILELSNELLNEE